MVHHMGTASEGSVHDNEEVNRSVKHDMSDGVNLACMNHVA